ncbi:uncharacterized protein [Nicotiana sylvestris]|uniref:uncharacterized protein n=1 Tax=Nicotiana sylvestris TaxID=4096 RepID=UPI00388C5F47
MAKKKVIETFDILLKDLMDTDALLGGKVVVFGGDFRQTLPVVRSGKKEDFIQESLLYSEIWNQLEKLRLSENMRAKTDLTFCEYLMRIRNGQEKINSHDKIEIPDCFVIPFISENQSLDLLFRDTYPDLHKYFSDASSITSRVILTTKNDFVDQINDLLIAQFPGDPKTYVVFDETIEANDQSQYEDFLHTLYPAGLPPYKLTLKKNCPVMLFRNLNPREGEVEVAKEPEQSSDAKVKCEMGYPTCLAGESQKVDASHVDNSLLCGELLASYIDSFAHNLSSSTKRWFYVKDTYGRHTNHQLLINGIK